MIHYRLANFFSILQFIVSGKSWNDTLQAGKFFSTLQFIVSGKSWNDTLQAGKFFFNLTIHRFREKLE